LGDERELDLDMR